MKPRLRRVLGFWDAVTTGIAAMVGAGIFVVSGIGAGIAGPGVILAFLLAGIVALFNALSTAQLAAAIPAEGAAYEYGRGGYFQTDWIPCRLAFCFQQDP